MARVCFDFGGAHDPARAVHVKNTFIDVGDEDSDCTPMRSLRSVPSSFRFEGQGSSVDSEDSLGSQDESIATPKDQVCRLRTFGNFDDDALPAVCRLRTGGNFDDDATPAVCRWRAGGNFDDESAPAAPASAPLPTPALAPSLASPLQPPPGSFQRVASQAQHPCPATTGRAAPARRGALAGRGGRRGGAALAAVRGWVWRLAQEVHGCRRVQELFDEAADDERRALAAELVGHVWEAAQCPQANFVLQKAVTVMRSEDVQFIIDELPAARAAKHKTACRVVQRLIEQCPPEQLTRMLCSIEEDFSNVARSPYGNYVVQRMIEYGAQDQRLRVMHLVVQDVKGLSADPFGSAVLSGALVKGPASGQALLARALVQEPGLLAFLACTRHGSTSVLKALQVLTPKERAEAQTALSEHAPVLMASRFGRAVAHKL